MAAFAYGSGHRYHVTVVTDERRPHFRDDRWARLAVEHLTRAAAVERFTLDAYCIMPDHVHAPLSADAEVDASLHAMMRRFKQGLGFAFKRETGRALWQRSYHDHVLRPDEDPAVHAAYVIGNPVRAGLVLSVEEWPYSGPRDRVVADAGADRSEDLSLQVATLAREREGEKDR
jgi:REP element-mobilizing transposase RayT